MTNTTARAQNSTALWPQRFGTLKQVAVKNGRKGRYAIATVDCQKLEQVAFAFGDRLVDQLAQAGAGAKVWFKIPWAADRDRRSGRVGCSDTHLHRRQP